MIGANPAKDRVAIAGIGRSNYHRRLDGTDTVGALTLRACQEAIRDAGLSKDDIDGVCGSMVNSQFVEVGLGLKEVTWFANPELVIGNQLVAAHNAIWSGAATTVVVYHTVYRLPFQSSSAARDPLRVRSASLEARSDYRGFYGTGHVDFEPFGISGPTTYAPWASRYIHEYGLKREQLGLVALNAHTNALRNPEAALHTPLTMEEYLQARMVRDPLTIHDMDVVVDGADAYVLTTAERAADLRQPPVLIHHATLGRAGDSTDIGNVDFEHTGQQVVARRLREGADFEATSADVIFPYDGFSIIFLLWLESLGFCGRGEAGAYLEDHWDAHESRFSVNGHARLNPHGGSLTEGATQGAGHIREAVKQLRGQADERQIPDARTALVASGGMLYNAQGFLLRNGDS
jgi:acetyl-CoA acetyltransferase